MMVTRIFAILGLMLIGTCYGIHLMPQTSYGGSYQNSYPQQIYGFMGYGGRSNPAGIRWNYKPNFKSPVVMIPNPTVEEPMMRSIVYQARPGQDPQRFFAKRSAPDMNPDFDHFSANRGKRFAGRYNEFAGNMDSDFDHFSGFYQMAKRSAPDMNPDFDHFSANRGKRSAGDMGPNFDDFGATRG